EGRTGGRGRAATPVNRPERWGSPPRQVEPRRPRIRHRRGVGQPALSRKMETLRARRTRTKPARLRVFRLCGNGRRSRQATDSDPGSGARIIRLGNRRVGRAWSRSLEAQAKRLLREAGGEGGRSARRRESREGER